MGFFRDLCGSSLPPPDASATPMPISCLAKFLRSWLVGVSYDDGLSHRNSREKGCKTRVMRSWATAGTAKDLSSIPRNPFHDCGANSPPGHRVKQSFLRSKRYSSYFAKRETSHRLRLALVSEVGGIICKGFVGAEKLGSLPAKPSQNRRQDASSRR
jgi:hypothetical protein